MSIERQTLLETAIALSRAEARRLLEAPPLIDREREILGEAELECICVGVEPDNRPSEEQGCPVHGGGK